MELSPDHRLIRDAARLDRGDERQAQGAFLVEGRRAIDDFLAAGWTAQALFARNDVELPAQWPDASTYRVGARAAAKLSQAVSPSGYVARFALPAAVPLDPTGGGLVLAEVADPGNVGTLLRSAAAFGIDDVVLVGGADPFAHKVVQASAGALARLRIHRLTDGLGAVRGAVPIAALVVAGGAEPEQWTARPCWLVVGSEADGIRNDWLSPEDLRWSLPMRSGSESLNAGVAGSIALYELARRAPSRR